MGIQENGKIQGNTGKYREIHENTGKYMKIQGNKRTHRVRCKLVPAGSIVSSVPGPEEALGGCLFGNNPINHLHLHHIIIHQDCRHD